jgi:hypothetical protein
MNGNVYSVATSKLIFTMESCRCIKNILLYLFDEVGIVISGEAERPLKDNSFVASRRREWTDGGLRSKPLSEANIFSKFAMVNDYTTDDVP